MLYFGLNAENVEVWKMFLVIAVTFIAMLVGFIYLCWIRPIIQMKKLYLNCNKFGDDGAKSLAASLHNIEVLGVSECGITNIGIEEIARNLEKLNKPMKKLYLTCNKLGDDCAKLLAACLHNIEVLVVIYCAFGDVGVEAIKN